MTFRKICSFIALLTLTQVWLVACEKPKSAEKKPLPTAMKKIDPSFFYRITADFKLKDTGEPIQFDYVAACGGYVSPNRHTTPTSFISAHPEIVFEALPDGKALGLFTIDMCDAWKWEKIDDFVDSPYVGQSRIPATLRPFAVWFDDVDDLSRGWGYATDAAYESPRAEIEFVSAKIEQTNATAWNRWRDEAADNYQQFGALPGPWGYSSQKLKGEEKLKVDQRGKGRGVLSFCSGKIGYIPLTDEATRRVFALSSAPKGHAWVPTHEEADELGRLLESFPLPDGSTFSLRHYNTSGRDSLKMGGTFSPSTLKHIHPYSGMDPSGMRYRQIYPLLPLSALLDDVEAVPQSKYSQELLFNEQYKGFAFCYLQQRPWDMLMQPIDPYETNEPFDPEVWSKRHELRYSEQHDVVLNPWGSFNREQAPILVTRDGDLFLITR